ncbi:hypothetical protein BVRB_1g023030 [Beta vulgaris subsp. vulgaris]|uniref:Uncharacterized protein n=1 Tax=Beta vulgaris subsp. vulgaris TaxID=3555 RepID=A0A0J8BHL6_BETVV|nr:hypothetical protein BVRB_1g023030 [Beta vulgaris subsp. vulgaris]
MEGSSEGISLTPSTSGWDEEAVTLPRGTALFHLRGPSMDFLTGNYRFLESSCWIKHPYALYILEATKNVYPSKRPKFSPPTTSVIVTPRGTDERREVAKEDAPKSKGKSAEVLEAGEISSSRGDDSVAPKKRKTLDPKADVRALTEKTTIEKAALFDSVVKRFISRSNIKAIRALFEEEEVEQLHSSWIDKLIIEEWKNSKEGKNFAVDMGLEAAEVATQEPVAKLREDFKKIYPSAKWETVEAEYNAVVNAKLQVDDDVDIGDRLAEDVLLIEGVPSTVEAPVASGEESHEGDSGERQNSSNHDSSESDEDDDDEEDFPETSDSKTSSSSA